MNAKTEIAGDLSYFRLSLQSFLNVGHPELANDQKFIESRSDAAAEAFEQAFKDEYPVYSRMEIANQVLFEGLLFSKFNTLMKVITEEFADKITREKSSEFALKMMLVCDALFIEYSLSDDFDEKPEFEKLYNELTGTILIWLENNESGL